MPLQRSNTDIFALTQPVNTERPFRNSGGLVKQGHISDLKIRRGATARNSFYEVHFTDGQEGSNRRTVVPLSWLRTSDGRTFDHLKPTDPESLASNRIKAMLMGRPVKAFWGGPIAPLRNQLPRTAGSNERNPYAKIEYVVLHVPGDGRLSRHKEIESGQRPPGPGGFIRSSTI